MKDIIDKLRRNYFEAINCLTNREDIIASLPTPNYDNFFPLMTGLMSLLMEKIDSINEELLSIEDDDLMSVASDELELLSFKYDLCASILEDAIKDNLYQEEFEEHGKKNLIFAKTSLGNLCVERDLKGVPEENYDDVLKLLTYLEDGISEDNVEKGRIFTNNAKFKSLAEIKKFNIRIVYKNLSSDLVYVLLITQKKANRDLVTSRTIDERAQYTEDDFEFLSKLIEDSLEKDKLIAAHAKFKDELFEMLNKNRRGRNV